MNMYGKMKKFIRKSAWYDAGIWLGVSIVLSGCILLLWHQKASWNAFLLVMTAFLLASAVIILALCQHRLAKLRRMIQTGGTISAFENEQWIRLQKGMWIGRNWLVQQDDGHFFITARRQIQDLQVRTRLDGNGILHILANGKKMTCLLDIQNHPEIENILGSWQHGSIICPSCLGINDPENRFCTHCGTPLPH